jgi:hypothetical protein
MILLQGLGVLLFATGAVGLNPATIGKERASMGSARIVAPKPRKDAFFGMHFDLHPQASDTALGADTTESNIAELLDRVKPDYVQYDCKGHAGYSGYPTRIGSPSPGIVKDALATWRKVTRERGVGLYIHYSGVWDSRAIELHPEWARIGPDGKPDPHNTSVFGDYADKLMIPQLIEALTQYDLDGAWVDGECWAAQLDWSPRAIAEWKARTGQDDVPQGREHPKWLEWKQFHRAAFEEYLSRWVDAVHAACPKAQLTSNWMYTTFAPRPVKARLDYLSGDYAPTASVDRARTEARYLASTGMPWDLMAWGFNWGQGLGHSLKSAAQLQQEAAVVLMQGGGFQVYYQPTRSGYIVPDIISTMSEVARFCRARQEISHKSTSVPQVALLLSRASQEDRSDAVFTPYGCQDEIEGALHALLEAHFSVDILAEHQLQPRLGQYPVVVLPETHRLDPDFRQALVAYVQAGGSLLLLGTAPVRLFAQHLGVRLIGEPAHVAAELATPLGVVNHNGAWQRIELDGADVVGLRYPTRDTRAGAEPAATIAKLGKGRIAAVYGPVALNHFRTHYPATREFLKLIMNRLLPQPLVRVDAPDCVDIALRRTANGRLALHLLNRANMQIADRYLSTEAVPAVGPIAVSLSVPTKPARVRWLPSGGRVRWVWQAGTLTATIPRLDIHGVLVVE